MFDLALGWLLAINVATAVAFWSDKRRAIAGQWRIREGSLLQMAFLGGWPAALAARRMFRHKTRKEPFSTYLLVIAAAEVGAGGVLLFT